MISMVHAFLVTAVLRELAWNGLYGITTGLDMVHKCFCM